MPLVVHEIFPKKVPIKKKQTKNTFSPPCVSERGWIPFLSELKYFNTIDPSLNSILHRILLNMDFLKNAVTV